MDSRCTSQVRVTFRLREGGVALHECASFTRPLSYLTSFAVRYNGQPRGETRRPGITTATPSGKAWPLGMVAGEGLEPPTPGL
ncbi:hypothetical protein MTBUT4_150023 [Magnetospirillum sp. UT-4]|nr:hypothetical protein MTBUT4_150023 [Magnetospirillum sp. UT-4]